ncbi:MAG TPA: cell division protein FtsZ [Ktedonobacteraceae bacterium]|nr:cell division protein FtsZ [Ktedonobacteraceae bacterium]
MQPMSHDAYKRNPSLEAWAEKARARPDVYEEPEDQWAVLRHEVEGKDLQKRDERVRSDWDQRYTDEDTISARSPFSRQLQGPHAVDIAVVGVGGGGMNAVGRMIHAGVRGVRFIALNTDAQVLTLSQAQQRICLGQHHTKGLGAGGNAAVGARAATESAAEIRAALGNADLVFIAAGMGGGTGTGAAPVVASIAKKLGALTVGIVTFPFTFEGTRRRRIAEQGLTELRSEIDALITVPNDRLLSTVDRDRNLSDAFKIADDVLRQGVQGIAEVINVPGMINVDFADVRSVLREAGTALMSIGQGQGRNRAQRAAEEAVAGGFLNVTIRGAKRVLFNISGGEDMTLFEVNEVAERIGESIDSSADITFGAVIDPSLQDAIRVTLIAAGMDEIPTARIQAIRMEQPGTRNAMGQAGTAQRAPMTPQVRPMAPSMPPSPPPTRMPPSVQPGPPARQQRSLNDLRGIRSMGRRQEMLRRQQADPDDDAIDVPPFLKRFDE